jgi:hypothetical protein
MQLALSYLLTMMPPKYTALIQKIAKSHQGIQYISHILFQEPKQWECKLTGHVISFAI